MKEWPGENYPPWAHGPGYVVSRDIAKAVVKMNNEGRLKVTRKSITHSRFYDNLYSFVSPHWMHANSVVKRTPLRSNAADHASFSI